MVLIVALATFSTFELVHGVAISRMNIGADIYIVVLACRNLFLSNGDFTAYRALLTVSQAGSGAGCSVTGNGFVRMCKLFNNSLSNEDFAA